LTSLNKIYRKQITAFSDSKKDIENNGLINSSLCQQKDDNKINLYQTVLKKITKPINAGFATGSPSAPHIMCERPNKGFLGQRFKVTISINLNFLMFL